MADSKVTQKLHELRRKGREEHLRLMGVEVKKLRRLERQIDGEFAELAAGVKKKLPKMGADVAEMHDRSRDRTAMIAQKTAEGVLSPDITDVRPRMFCVCFSHNSALQVDGCSHSTTITPSSGGTGTASTTFGSAGCESHPMVEARGQGTGTTNSAENTVWCRYAFMPSVDGLYCIKPQVFLNGHYLVWTWGTCSGTAEDLGTAKARTKITVQVDQLSLPVKTIEHTVVDQTVSGGSDSQSGFAYDSDVDGGISTSVLLQGGHEAVVWVKCTSFAEVTNHGRAWVDMQTSPQFYFKVDDLRWGRVLCFPWHPWHHEATPITLPAEV